MEYLFIFLGHSCFLFREMSFFCLLPVSSSLFSGKGSHEILAVSALEVINFSQSDEEDK